MIMDTKKHFCGICEKGFLTKQGVERHMNYIHGNPDTFKCDVCDYETPSETRLEEHQSVVHLKKKLHKCHVCSKEFGYKKTLKNHINEKHNFDFEGYHCDKCDFSADSREKLRYHQRKIHNIGPKQEFKCEPCGKFFKASLNLDLHIKSLHKGIRYHCDEFGCGSTFTQKSSLRKHFQDYHGEDSKQIHKCELCHKILSTKSKLKEHVKNVHNEVKKMWYCDSCDFLTKDRAYLKRHIENFHSKGKSYKCEMCSKAFKSLEYLNRHKKRRHTKQDKRFSCDQCDYRTMTKQTLETHKNGVHLGLRPFKCKACGQGFTQNAHMNSHYQRVHLGLKPYKCKYCDKSVSSNQEMKLHLAAIHDDPEGAKKLKCDKCDFSTLSSKSLKNHSFQHGKPKPHKCEHCEKAYVKKAELNIHMINAHSDEAAFPCNFCSMAFMSKPGLNYHIIAEHPQHRQIEWYKCDQCEYQSKHKIGLKMHKKIHMEDTDDKVTCDICELSVSKTYLSTHMKTIHEEEGKLFNCDLCDFKTKYKYEVKKHKDAVHLGLRHRCELCGKDFAQSRNLTAHKKRMH